ncbi:MAG: hypothetical protein MPN21_24105 [Thermoanaerobaculia bacterium]|nr:hypothetical protein [Thermoanaerobaculia bacterium]
MTSDSRDRHPPPDVDLTAEAGYLEDLAALADGTLEGSRRDEVLERLDGDEDALAILAEVVALQDEAREVALSDDVPAQQDDSDDGTEEARDPTPEDVESEGSGRVIRGPWRTGRLAWATAIAAGLAVVTIAPRVLAPGAPTPQSVIAALETSRLTVPSEREQFWSPPRGGSMGDIPPVLERMSARDSFRLGVLATDFEAALLLEDDPWRQRISSRTQNVVDEPILESFYRELANSSHKEALADHRDLQDVVLSAADPFFYRYGLYLRAAWLAASSGQLEFFEGRAARSLDALQPPDEEIGSEIDALRQHIDAVESEADLAELANELDRIARKHAR